MRLQVHEAMRESAAVASGDGDLNLLRLDLAALKSSAAETAPFEHPVFPNIGVCLKKSSLRSVLCILVGGANRCRHYTVSRITTQRYRETLTVMPPYSAGEGSGGVCGAKAGSKPS